MNTDSDKFNMGPCRDCGAHAKYEYRDYGCEYCSYAYEVIKLCKDCYKKRRLFDLRFGPPEYRERFIKRLG